MVRAASVEINLQMYLPELRLASAAGKFTTRTGDRAVTTALVTVRTAAAALCSAAISAIYQRSLSASCLPTNCQFATFSSTALTNCARSCW
jgi:hypothetical protein